MGSMPGWSAMVSMCGLGVQDQKVLWVVEESHREVLLVGEKHGREELLVVEEANGECVFCGFLYCTNLGFLGFPLPLNPVLVQGFRFC